MCRTRGDIFEEGDAGVAAGILGAWQAKPKVARSQGAALGVLAHVGGQAL
jgi:hypothetical protein